MSNRYRDYADFHQCSMQEAKRVLMLEDRIKALHAIHSRLGEVYTPQAVADQLRNLIDLLVKDAEVEYRR